MRDSCETPRELGNFEAATESFQKALLLNQNHVQTLQLRGLMLYHHGSLQEALKNFKVSPSEPAAGVRGSPGRPGMSVLLGSRVSASKRKESRCPVL